jgi:very-short-patch-repair endonuclease
MPRPAEFVGWLSLRGGVAHSAEARAAGFTTQAMVSAVQSGRVSRVRRSWLVLPGVDERLVRAISAGGRLTCVSAAARRGLWVPPHDELHIAVKATASRVPRDGVIAHWSSGPAPVGRYASEDPIVNALLHVSECMPREEALTVWESALRRGAVSLEALRRIDWGSSRARAIVDACSTLSDSGLETIFRSRLTPFGVAIRQQIWIDGHPVDFLIGESLVVQVDGFEHHSSAADRRRDIAADARLTLLGFTVLRFDYQQVMFDWPMVERTVLAAVAQGLHRGAPSRR